MVAHGERTSPNGQELLAEFVQYGHQKPFEEIVRRYAGMVFNVCVRITKDKHEAEDATQAVFLTLALQAKRGTEIKALGPWLQQVAKRLSLDLRRSKKRRKTREERHEEEQTQRRESILGDAMPEADLDELKTVLHEELQKLPAKYRLPLILHYFGGLTRDEMAAELGCKPSTLGVRIFRGREMLAGRLSGRGIHISAGALAVALGYTVKRAISDSLISSTSYAAAAIAGGHSGAGLASSQVIGLTRRAGSALVIGKVKIAALTLLIAGTSLGASVKAMDMIPAIDVRQMISNQVQRMVRPLFAPFSVPIRADARPQSKTPTVTVATSQAPIFSLTDVAPIVARNGQASAVAKPAVVSSSNAPLTVVTPSSQMPAPLRMPWVDATAVRTDDGGTPLTPAADDHDSGTSKSADVADASTSGAAGAGGGAGGSAPDLSGTRHSSDGSSARAATPSLPVPLAIASPNNLVVPPALKSDAGKSASKSATGSSSSSSPSSTATNSTTSTAPESTTTVSAAPTGSSTSASAGASSASLTGTGSTANSSSSAGSAASPAVQIVQIPATNNGNVTESNGEVRGYGTVNRTGTIDMDGKVVADGQSVDRTLNLKSFTAIQKDISNASAGGQNGWYAVDHGRLSLSLMAGPNQSFTWGEATTATQLDLVNSVRLTFPASTATDAVPASLSLLSPDRTDLPSLQGINGAPIGIWQVDPASGSIADAELTVRYNDVLIAELGASESSVSLWTLCPATDSWANVSPSTFSLDTADHTVSGDAQDFSYFAVAVPPPPGEDVGYLIANPQTTLGQVPEPFGLAWLALGGATLARRRARRL